jgi:hypothetical protein
MRWTFLFITLLTTKIAFSQSEHNDSSNTFQNGIYLENLNITIPWAVRFSEIRKYGNPKIDKTRKSYYVVTWDSLEILKGIVVELEIPFEKKLLCKRDSMRYFFCYLRSEDAERVRNYFNKRVGFSYTQFWASGCTWISIEHSKKGSYLYVSNVCMPIKDGYLLNL